MEAVDQAARQKVEGSQPLQGRGCIPPSLFSWDVLHTVGWDVAPLIFATQSVLLLLYTLCFLSLWEHLCAVLPKASRFPCSESSPDEGLGS